MFTRTATTEVLPPDDGTPATAGVAARGGADAPGRGRMQASPGRRRVATALGLALLAAAAAEPAWAGSTERVSVGPGGVQADRPSDEPALSGDGRLVAFASEATNLVAGDTNGESDVFVHDRVTRQTRRVSVGPGGAQGDSVSYRASISADGRFVAFHSRSDNLVPGDTNAAYDTFVHDLATGVTSRVSVGPGGAQANGVNTSARPGISANGRFVVFCSEATGFVGVDTNDTVDVFVHDRERGTTRRVTVGLGGAEPNGLSFGDAISANGRHVAFWSFATNLVRGSDTNDDRDVFVRDLAAGTTRKVSVGRNGAQANGLSSDPTLSADGRLVGFFSTAPNLVAGDTNGGGDGFVRDLAAGRTRRVTLTSRGTQANRGSSGPVLSGDGRFAAFGSRVNNLVPGDTNRVPDVFVRRLDGGGTTERVNVGPGGVQANGAGFGSLVISADGHVVAFSSFATNLVPGDTNLTGDVFVRVR